MFAFGNCGMASFRFVEVKEMLRCFYARCLEGAFISPMLMHQFGSERPVFPG